MAVAHRHDVLDLLTDDHREVQERFAAYEAGAVDRDERRDLVDHMIIEWVQHSVAEERYLYPSVRRRLPEGDRIADSELDKQAAAERTMNELDGLDPDDDRFDRLVRQLAEEIGEHIRSEEREVFPALQLQLAPEERAALGENLITAKRTGPVHPHPHTPDEPPFNKALLPGAGLVDRVKDWLSGRGR
jgi:hemerythrin superfamily protein